MLRLHNPHSIAAALETRPGDVSEIILPQGGQGRSLGEAWDRVLALARKNSVRVSTASGASGKRAERERPGVLQEDASGGRTGLAEALVREREPLPIEELFAGARERASGKGLWIALDSLQDPHNVGAILRTAAFFGAQGAILTQERSAPLSATVYDVASGGIEYLPLSVQVNLQRAFEKAKDAGLWILGTSEHAGDHASQDYRSIERDRPWLLVIGNEEKGMRRLTGEACDVICRIPSSGRVGSLNASVAAAVLISRLSEA